MKKVKLKAKRKCHCEEHYLELCTSFDGKDFIYKRFCYQCGKTWTYTERFTISVPRTEVTENTIMFDDACQYCYVYTLNKDGTVGDLLRLVRY